MKYFLITCVRGHCGNGHSTEIKFAFEAKDLLSACDKAKRMPSVKHTRLVLHGKEITKEEYIEYRKISAYERYAQGHTGRRR